MSGQCVQRACCVLILELCITQMKKKIIGEIIITKYLSVIKASATILSYQRPLHLIPSNSLESQNTAFDDTDFGTAVLCFHYSMCEIPTIQNVKTPISGPF